MVSKGVTIDLEALRMELRDARDNERPNRVPNLREAVQVLLPEIEGLRRARWSDMQVSEFLGKRGLNISAGTLAQYVREARKSAAGNAGEPKSDGRLKRPVKENGALPFSRAQRPAVDPFNGDSKASAKASDTSQQAPVPEVSKLPVVRSPDIKGAIPKRRGVNDEA